MLLLGQRDEEFQLVDHGASLPAPAHGIAERSPSLRIVLYEAGRGDMK
jgi:hypothetical protein